MVFLSDFTMKISLQSQNPLEWLVLQTGLIPQPILLAHFGFIISKIIGEAVEHGVLAAIAPKQQSASAIASHCNLNEKAVAALLNALTGLQLVRYGNQKFTLTTASKKWLLKDSQQSYGPQVLFDSKVCYPWLSQTGAYLKTGKGLQYHETLQPAEWQLYQDAMQATSGLISQLAAKKIKLPAKVTQLLDVGGAHGLYSTALLKKYPQLFATVFDLPESVAANAQKPNPYPDRLLFTAGNILKEDLQHNTFDAIIMANVAHHFTEVENKMVAQKIFASLKPGGTFYILEFFRRDISQAAGDMIGALQSFFFSFSSTSGLWTAPEIKGWLAETGFQHIKLQNFIQLPGFGMVQGQKGVNEK